MNEVQKFFEDLPKEDKQVQNVFDDPTKTVPVPEKGEENVEVKPEEGRGEPRKNRQHRRLENDLREAREMNIALNERVRVLSEVKDLESGKVQTGDMPAEWVALYGDSPEAQKAWNMQERMWANMKNEARVEALEEFEFRQASMAAEEHQFEQVIDSELESLEDVHNIDLTSNAPAARKARGEFLELVQEVSPKDEEGNIIEFADFNTVFDIYRKNASQKGPDNSRQKEIAARSMQDSSTGRSGTPQPNYTPGFRGWMKDLNLGN